MTTAKLTTLVDFNSVDGANPSAELITDAAGDLFGVTYDGGAYGDGAVFEIAKTSAGYARTATILASFNGADGSYPMAGALFVDAAGDLFGTTLGGGAYGDGEVFEIAKTSDGYASTPTVLASFNGADGSGPRAGLIADADGNLLGTTEYGGAYGDGAVFEIAKIGDGYASTPTVLVSFNGANGSNPYGGLITDAAGNLFGTTNRSGAHPYGEVFEIAKTKTGYASTPTVLASFNWADGAYPQGELIADAAGNLFGTAGHGGAYGDGVVFEIAKTSDGYASTPTVLASFNGADGANPRAALIVDAAGNLFSITSAGGAYGDGVVFEIAKTSDGYASTPTVLTSFNGADGATANAALMADAAGDLFGTTIYGGASGDGTAYELSAGAGFQVTIPTGGIDLGSLGYEASYKAVWNPASSRPANRRTRRMPTPSSRR